MSKTVDNPLNPARIVNRLRGDRRRLPMAARPLGRPAVDPSEEELKWRPPDRLRAIRLLGKQPLDAVDDMQVMSIYLACWAMDPDGPHSFQDAMNELDDAEQKRFIERAR